MIEEIMKNKEDLLIKLLDVLEGREAKASVNLEGVEFMLGKSKIKLGGKVEVSFLPYGKKK
ncbi:MAG: hypothetical protein V3V26_00955 [Candidatus Aenigmarchaeota archaeon]